MLSGFIGGVFAVILYKAYSYYKYKKVLSVEIKELDEQLNKLFKVGVTTPNMPKFQKGDFLVTKDKTLQHWEKEQPPAVFAEVLEVGDGEYLLDLSIPGYASGQQTLSFVEVHASFNKDTTKKQKPVFKIVQKEEQV